MPRIRNIPGRFGQVAPGGGAAVGAGLQAAGQALGQLADVRTNMELLDIREQEQIERLEFAQFEKVERSEAIKEFTAKQIWRNQESDRLLVEAHKNRDFGDVQGQMNFLEDDFNAVLFENRSQVFQEAFESMDRSRRVSNINVLGTAVQRGNLGLIQENYQIAADNFVESVNASMSPAEINDFFDALDENGVNVGFTQAAIEAASGQGRREAMERLVRSLPLVEGLAALSDEGVAKALGEEGRERMRRDLNTKANTLRSAQEITSAAHAGVVGLNVLDALVAGESATALISRIRSDDGISPTRQKDMIDLVDVISRAREKGPQEVDSETIKANQELSKGRVNVLIKRAKAITDKKDLSEEDEKKLRQISEEALSIYFEDALKEEEGAFGEVELIKLRFQIWPITEGFFLTEEAAKQGLFDKITKLPSFLLSPSLALSLSRGADETTGVESRIPSSIVSGTIGDMFLGEGRYGSLPSKDKASVEVFLIDQTNKTKGSNKPLPTEEANAMAHEIFAVVDRRFLQEEKGIAPEAVDEVKGIMLNSGTPATEPIQQPDISPIADSIRDSLSRGKTIEEIEEFARTRPRFSQGAFDRALATVGVARTRETALSGELGTLRGESGTVSTEISVTVTDPRLNDGKPTNIPTLVEGQVNVQGLVDSGNPTNEQVDIAISRAIERQARGALLPSFESVEQAERAAIERHEREERRTR